MIEERYWDKLEKIYVHQVYENISSKYEDLFKTQSSSSRTSTLTNENELDENRDKSNENLNAQVKHKKSKYNAWPNVKRFLLELEPYSLIADVGCGDGKYLNLNTNSFTLGCDYSSSLCKLASLKQTDPKSICNQNQLLTCDNLRLPFRSHLFDAVISIGVIHHFSTEQRRIDAVKECVRILKPGGRIMIYVWAMEQRMRKFNSQDVLVPMLVTSHRNSNKTNRNKENCEHSPGSQRGDTSNDSNFENSSDSDSVFNEKSAQVDCSSQQDILDFNGNRVSKKHNETTPTVDLNQFDQEKVKGGQQPLEQDHLTKTEKSNFVENFKTFLVKRFSVKSSSCSESKQSNETSKNQPASPLHTSPLENEACNNGKCSPSHRLTSIESYQRIIEDYKECLPKDFTIRHFPHSSCSDTFENSNATMTRQNKKENLNCTKFNKQQADELMNNASSRLSSSQSTPSSNGCSTPNQSSFDTLEPTQTPQSNTQLKIDALESSERANRTNKTQQENSNNQRFYHVFKRNELDSLIQTHCANLVIFNSYYDHGNWCICATKTDD